MKQGYAPDPANDRETSRPTAGEQAAPVAGAAKEVVQSVKEHARDVGGEAVERGRNLAGQVGERLSEEARSQNDRLVSGLQKLADDLEQMSDGNGSVAATMAQQVGATSRQAATYLQQHGPEGLLREVQEFARRKPGVFLIGAAVAGFVAGRVGKGLLSSESTTTPSAVSAGTVPAGVSRMTGVAFTPTGELRPTATGAAPLPSEPLAGAPVGSGSRGGAGS